MDTFAQVSSVILEPCSGSDCVSAYARIHPTHIYLAWDSALPSIARPLDETQPIGMLF